MTFCAVPGLSSAFGGWSSCRQKSGFENFRGDASNSLKDAQKKDENEEQQTCQEATCLENPG